MMKYKTIEQFQVKTGNEIRSIFMDGEYWMSVFKSESLSCGNETRMFHHTSNLKCEQELLDWASNEEAN